MPIPFRIRQINTRQFAMFPDLLVNGEGVTVTSEFSFGVNNEVNDISCVTKLTYSQNDKLLLTIEVICFFAIGEEGRRHFVDSGRVEVTFLRYLATIATGTVRGIIHTKTENTALNPVVLPPLNLMEVIKEDFVFKNVG
ncbi:MAG: hypothetical protein J5554_07865 [Paludibacteraceae bacterium]|nr:hypothetical protein [Paludibacteraceae bacterium]